MGESDYPSWFFQWAFAATAATTVSGCMAERTKFVAYLIYSWFITALIYPIVVRWLWADDGWLCAWGKNGVFGLGMIDFAGSGVVHMLGGVAGLVGSAIVGPRKGYFTGDRDKSTFRGHSLALTALGVYVRSESHSRTSEMWGIWFRVPSHHASPNECALPPHRWQCLWFGWFGFNAGYTFGVTKG
eukprot:6891606-Prymnesium_polylepis.1